MSANMNSEYYPRPALRFTPQKGWTNDPNGLIFDGTRYHLFAQYNPNDIVWGPMHWLHAISPDMLHWDELGVALTPDHNGTIFSGSAVLDPNNTAGFGSNAMVLMYTHHGDKQTQSIAYSIDYATDDPHFIPYAGNPVIPNPGETDFRDPKVIWHDGGWTMVLAAGNHIEFYRSPNLKSWRKTGVFGEGLLQPRQIYECTDLFPMNSPDGSARWMLIASVGGPAELGGGRVRYFIGDYDGITFAESETLSRVKWIDDGFDNYAGVTFSGTDQRIYIGWAANLVYAGSTPASKFRGGMTLPRLLTLAHTNEGLSLASHPILPEGGAITRLADGSPLPDSAYTIDLQSNDAYTLMLCNNRGESFVVSLSTDGWMTFDRTHAGNRSFDPWYATPDFSIRTIKRRVTGESQLTIAQDGDLIEVFADGGTIAGAFRIFPSERYSYCKLTGSAEGGVRILT